MQMRQVLANGLEKLMEKDERIVIVDADLAKASGTLCLREIFPKRAFDVGVAEQNMASIAAGLASYGFKPYITSFSPFASRRICDQIAISICYAKQNVKIIGTDPGIAAELNGGTHMGIEDIGVLRSIPGIVIVEATDEVQLRAALPVIDAYEGPLYLRMVRKEVPLVFKEDYYFDLFKADVIRTGQDLTIFACGLLVKEALLCAEELEKVGILAEVINVHTIKPIDKETVISSLKKTKCAVVAENHNVHGGLGSAIAEVVCEYFPSPLKFIGIQDKQGEVGVLDYLQEVYQLRAIDIYNKSLEVIKQKGVLG